MASSVFPRYGKIFNDPIHRTMEIPSICVRIIDTPQFQRLRHIKQLAGNYFVYSGACHNRFEHSIGVCHLAGKLFTLLVDNQPELYEGEEQLKQQHLKCLQIAGLCHDLGHGPYSHTYQDFFLPALKPEDCPDEEWPKLGWKHELGSQKMFKHLVEENRISLTEDEIELILYLILPKTEQTEKHFPALARDKKFLFQIVSNKETGIDVDKFDYLARDCHHLGLGNSFDSERLMKLARVIGAQICYPIKERESIRSLFNARSELHRKAYQHKTAKCIELMLTDAMLEVKDVIKLPGKDGSVSIANCVDDPVAYTLLTDNIITMIQLHEITNDPPDAEYHREKLNKAKGILDRLAKRKLYKLVDEYWTYNEEGMKFDQLKVEKSIKSNATGDSAKRNCVVHVAKFNCGQDGRNPMSKVSFFHKNDPNNTISNGSQKRYFSKEIFTEEVVVRVYSRSKTHLQPATRAEGDQLMTELRKATKKWVDSIKLHKKVEFQRSLSVLERPDAPQS